ncbi:MAG: HEAT repeat domain-containing protein [Deltaproteobacteria bacterium]|nr:HEAT repeat domain-containing protein [Deltaproteobacteria bacterium]
MKRRTADELRAALATPGFTPALRDADGLLELLAGTGRDEAEPLERALVRIGPLVVPRLLARFPPSVPPLRGRLCRLLGRLAPEDPAVRTLLLGALEDADDATRRHAARALGHLREPEVEAALLRAWACAESIAFRRALAEALGKAGSANALDALRDARPGDPELARRVARAVLMLERTATRTETSTIRADAAPAEPQPLLFTCRAGLEPLLAEELGPEWRPRVVGPGQVEAQLRGALASAWSARIATEVAFVLPTLDRGRDESLADVVVRLLTGPTASEVLRRWTAGPVRYRIAFAGGGHRRAVVWEIARRTAERRPELQNDPTGSPWELRVAELEGHVRAALCPRGLPDPRFAWRVADVPASSHPTLAAALARVGGARRDDVVWDPFVGSGAELLERARRGPFARLLGTDTDARALSAAGRNARAAGVALELARGEATCFVPPQRPTLVLTNPPMGRRTGGHRELGDLLERFVAHAAAVLAPGGLLVWLAPHSARSDPHARAAGLTLEASHALDMGGFRAELQRWHKP